MILERVGDDLVRLPCFYAAHLLTTEACQTAGAHDLVLAKSDNKSIGSYAIKRPDHRLAVVLLNRSPNPASVSLKTNHKDWDQWTYSSDQYQWKPAGSKGQSSRSM